MRLRTVKQRTRRVTLRTVMSDVFIGNFVNKYYMIIIIKSRLIKFLMLLINLDYLISSLTSQIVDKFTFGM